MFKPLALATAAGLLLAFGCDKKSPDPADLLNEIPTVAPEAPKGAGTVFERLQYAMVRKDPKYLEHFYPADDKSRAMGATQQFHNNAGYYRLGLTPEEIDKLGLQELVQDGWISDQWTTRDFKDAMEGKREIGLGMEKLNEYKLDMPYVRIPFDPKDKQAEKQANETVAKLNKELTEALEKNPEAIYAGGLYRLLKAIPDLAWVATSVTVGTNSSGKEMNDLVLKAAEVHYATIAVGKKADGTMYIDAVKYETEKGHGPGWLAKNFSGAKVEDAKEESK